MSIERVALIGAGGHASVVADAAGLSGIVLSAVFSENAAQSAQRMFALPVQLLTSEASVGSYHLCMGDNATRARLHTHLSGRGFAATTIRHPAAVVAATSEVAAGSFIAAGAILAPRTGIGACTVVNHRAVVDHDVQIGNFVHVAPGATLGGGVRLGDCVLVGAGAIVLPGISVGEGAIIGAGAVVLEDVPPNATVVGVPAKRI